MMFLILFLFLCTVCISVAQRCPPEENLAPLCFCKAFDTFSMMTCNKVMNPEELIPPIKGTEGYNIFSLSIQDSSLTYMPSDVFKNTKFVRIYFGNSQLMALSDSDLAFEGLEHTLEDIRARGENHYVTTWDWSQLRNHTRLKVVDIFNIAMHSLDNEFPQLPSLTHLGISKAEISFVHPQAFSELLNLEYLILKQNEISEMGRDMLPIPAKKLHHIDLSNNILADLPEDMFNGMPILKEVDLSNNKFVTLKEETFSGIFQSLQLLMLKGNKFRCDCRLRWLVGHPHPLYFEGNCNEPENMNGNTLKYLKHGDLWC